MLILAKITLSGKLFTAFSIIGVNCLQGEHHGAQKSTTTGNFSEPFITNSTKFSLVTSMILFVILILISFCSVSLALNNHMLS